MLRRIFLCFLVLVALSSCSGLDDDATGSHRLATVTFLVTPNGLGDNGYNDEAAEGVFAFAFQTGTRLHLLQPGSEEEAGQMYSRWLSENAEKDSVVLIIGSSVYEQEARKVSAAHQAQLASLRQHGGRVLLFETEAAMDGITTLSVSRYGASYLCGVLSGAFDALVLSAVKGNPLLEDSISGFIDGYNTHRTGDTLAEVVYLSDNASGFAMPDSAYHVMSARIAELPVYRDMVFPLLGGSGVGVLRAMNDEETNLGLIIGMDVDQSALSPRVPFSMVVHTGEVLHRYLDDWLKGVEWPATSKMGLANGGVDIMLHPSFYENNVPMDDRYRDPQTFRRLYDQYRDEAVRKEEEHER